jgi:hypothetical protein
MASRNVTTSSRRWAILPAADGTSSAHLQPMSAFSARSASPLQSPASECSDNAYHHEDGIVCEFALTVNQRKVLCFDVVKLINGTDEITAQRAVKWIYVFHINLTLYILNTEKTYIYRLFYQSDG